MTFNQLDIDRANKICQNTLVSHLGIEFFNDNGQLAARMPVSKNHLQPFGILHGGASLALAETLGSAFTVALVDPNLFSVVGMNIQANHIGSVSEGWIIARCKPVHLGKRTHVIDIEITSENNRNISICRLTNMLIPKD